jgi:hypothetical protein
MSVLNSLFNIFNLADGNTAYKLSISSLEQGSLLLLLLGCLKIQWQPMHV